MKISKATKYSAMATKKETECRTGAAHKDVVCDIYEICISLFLGGGRCVARMAAIVRGVISFLS